ncbi:MAG TPA: hypothetical protein ENG48_12245 [Candidatus Atribacteria bacterium]|nr:hypothetical protein [Candidatus Atribacteria bacterium]
MKCSKIEKLIHLHLDRVLPQDTSKELEEHLKNCSTCREEEKNWKKVFSSLNSIRPVSVPDNLTQKIMAKVSMEEINPSWIDYLKSRISIPRLSLRILGAAVAVTAIFAFFAFAFIFNAPDTSPLVCSAEVKFSLKLNDTKAHVVAIAGDFNGWNPQANLLEDPDGDGIWTGTLNLEPGKYEYMFVLDGEKWLPDPNALRYAKDGFGNKNAILEINSCNFI